ncbi:MAG: LysM peptidoglycan-binding domain-containing protein [Arenicella sp.]|nr:LysM peptidoglycan-binding domain-containing protein [Arenicella sp.]
MNSLFYVGMVVLLALLPPELSARQLDEPVGQYTLDCNDTFACPDSLLPRVSFWIEVFSRWETDTAIFHDKDNPQRVFSTVKREQGCQRTRRGDIIERERERLQKALRTTADRIRKDRSLSANQRYLRSLFIGESTSEIRAAAKRLRCQSGNRDRMLQALKQFQLYRPTILDALESQNLTPELQYLPFVESAFNPQALSHLGAAGLWQIMPSTGRSLGLVVNSVVDQRYDPTLATYAAAKYFRDSVDKLSSEAFDVGAEVSARELNPFVITSYNYGVRGMQNAIRQVGLSYERLLREYKSPNFQTAVKNFYASFLAARHVAKNAEQFFGDVQPDRSQRIHSFNTVSLKRATSTKRISTELDLDIDVVKQLNPSLKSVVWKDRALIPEGFQLHLPYREQGWSAQLADVYSLPREIERPGFVWHRVRRGQTACQIAESYRASCSALRKLNRLNRKATIYAGQRLKVPTRNGGITVASVPSSTASSQAGIVTYTVKRGESACIIANRNDMRCNEFLAINGLRRDSVLQIGQRVSIKVTEAWHTVRRGQTACQIAESYRVSCRELLAANQLTKASTILIGQRLRIPSRS